MPTHDFDAARRERQDRYDPVQFRLGGTTFKCRKAIAFEVLLQRIADESQAGPGAVFRFECDFVAECLENDAARTRWRKVLANPAEPIEEEDVFAVVRYLVSTYSARPTSPSSGSSSGRKRTGGRSSSTPTRRSPAKRRVA